MYARESRGEAAEYGVVYNTFYPLPMDWVYRFFTEEFWGKVVPRYGAEAYRPFRQHGVRQWCSRWGLQDGQQVVSSPEPESPEPDEYVLRERPEAIGNLHPV